MSRKKLPFKEYVWTPELAYATGLIVTDGHLSKDGRHIVLRSVEKEMIKNFQKCLNINHCKIGVTPPKNNGYSNRNSYRVQFGDVQLYRWLRTSVGIPPNKTYDIGGLNIPDSIFPDFLRGHLDGDGSITTYIDRYNTYKDPKYVYERLWVRYLSASEDHINWLQKRIIDILNISGHVNSRKPKRPRRQATMHQLKFGKKESIKLLNAIYYKDEIPCLKRKRDIAEKYLESSK